ncbi:hypothetical protein BV25DRAFT_1922575 [Artomyces pyxidatus]|uniref:Uncharacterized protein n=1 Tax=Artomyces pyxidatus TaxID=48021 RepID=A0ACB8SE15_9AGAM|nr:hypothetical protein BV25DRAFT_1922575 [Artomyces pyxidatus]
MQYNLMYLGDESFTSDPRLISEFHLIRDHEELARVLVDWEFLEEDGKKLYDLVKTLNIEFDEDRKAANAEKASKAKATREKNAQLKAEQEEEEALARQQASLQNQTLNHRAGHNNSSSSRLPTSPARQRTSRENVPPPPEHLTSPRRTRLASSVFSPTRKSKQRRL